MPRMVGTPEPDWDKVGKKSDVRDKEKVSQKLLEVGRCAEMFMDELGSPCAFVERDGSKEVLRMRSVKYEQWLAYRYYEETKKLVNTESLRSARRALEFEACHSGKKIKLATRFACRRGSLSAVTVLIDSLQLQRTIYIYISKKDKDGGRPTDPIFQRFDHQRPLPIPEAGGHVSDILQFLNVKNEDDKLLILVWLVTAMIADIPRPILCLHGPQGSAKTTAAKFIREVLDPSEIMTCTPKNAQAEWAQVLNEHAVPIFDNLRRIQPWQEEILTKAVTGDGFAKRALYTDSDSVIMRYQRAIILTAINIPTSQPDLLDRFLLVELERVSPTKRKTELALRQKYEALKPKIFGAMLKALSRALPNVGKMKHVRSPRMADFAVHGCAVAKALGFTEKKFLDAFARNAQRQHEAVVEAEPISRLLSEHLQTTPKWSGTAAELQTILRGLAPENNVPVCLWPAAVAAFSRHVRELQATLIDNGIAVKFGHRGKGLDSRRTIELCKVSREEKKPCRRARKRN